MLIVTTRFRVRTMQERDISGRRDFMFRFLGQTNTRVSADTRHVRPAQEYTVRPFGERPLTAAPETMRVRGVRS